jgi:putative FmdB family regulatory protein
VPIYEYKCANGHLFETFHGMMEPSPETCEVCGAGPLQRVLHPVAVHYKGSGFYSTDYGRKTKQPAKDSGGSEGSASEGSGSSSDGGGSGSSDGSGGSGGGSSDSGGGSGESGSGGKKTAEA